MSAEKLFSELQKSGIIGATGETHFELHGIKTLVRDSSIVGNVIQEWLKSFMDSKKIAYRIQSNSQKSPDFFMDPKSDQIGLLEVKCFKKAPNFDVANFMAYCGSLVTEAYRLDSDYLVFEYKENETGVVIQNIWLKKVWEICSASERTAVKTQIKKGIYYAIRPASWSSKKTKYPVFASKRDFVRALEKMVNSYSTANSIQKNWFQNVSKNYKKQTGRDL